MNAERIAEIRERLDASPPESRNRFQLDHALVDPDGKLGPTAYADLIAHAPDDLAFLLDLVAPAAATSCGGPDEGEATEMSADFEWKWWVVRDDGDRCGGPHDTREAAERQLRGVFDPSEYRVDHQYAPRGTGLDG